MKEELKQIIEELSEVIDEERLQILDRDLLDFALRLYNTQIINIKFKSNKLNNELKPSERDLKPTEAQIKACKKLRITIPKDSTKKDVWKLMNKKKEVI